MSKVFYIVPLFLLALFATAQEDNFSFDTYFNRSCQSNFGINTSFSPEEINSEKFRSLLQITHPDIKLKLVETKSSQIGYHHFFREYYNDIPVLDAQVKINTAKSGKILSIFNRSVDFNSNEGFSNIKSLPEATDSVILSEVVCLEIQNDIKPLLREVILKGDQNYEMISQMEGDVLFTRDLRTFRTDSAMAGDSIASMTVFYPDPLTSANQVYGSPYVDSNDVDFALLNNEIVIKNAPVIYDTNTSQYLLRNAFIAISDFSVPFISPATSATPSFNFTRSQSGFEDVNAFFHITNFQCYMQSLGFNLVDYAINVDTHGNGGNDNSFFTASSNPPRITFGEGNVDDAEDADVIVHEYGHAITHSAAPNTNSGVERQAIDEGFGDYLAASYSYSISTFNWDKVFSWDGHNPFWSGRLATSSKHYPDNLQNNLYQDADIWSSTLMEINLDIGREEFDKILFNSLYNYASGLSMAEAARLLVQADSVLNGGLYYDELCFYLGQRGFIPECSLSVENPDIESDLILIQNSAKFARGESLNIIFKSDGNYKVSMLDIRGRIIKNHEISVVENSQIEISSSDLPKGIYILGISKDDSILSHKVVRYQ